MSLKKYIFICYLALIHALALFGLCQTLKIGLSQDFKIRMLNKAHPDYPDSPIINYLNNM